MSRYGLAVLIVVGVTIALVAASAAVRGAVWALVRFLLPWVGTGGPPRSASSLRKRR